MAKKETEIVNAEPTTVGTFPTEVDLEIAKLKAQNEELRAKLANNATSTDNAIVQLADALKQVLPQNNNVQIPQDGYNRTIDFNNNRQTVDSISIQQSAEALGRFSKEATEPINIAKYYVNVIGPTCNVTVNGVRVSVPCDGKTYNINKTHAIHIKERLAKINNLSSKPGDVAEYATK